MRSAAGPSPLLPCTVAVATLPAFVVLGGVLVLFSGMASMEQQQQQLYTNDSASVVLFDSSKNAITSNDASNTCVG
jgi:hypothetical protein